MTSLIKESFDLLMHKTIYNKKLSEKVDKFKIDFINQNHDSIEFFGGKLIGNKVVRFPNRLLNDYYEMFDISEKAVDECIEKISSIDKSRIVTSDSFNILSMYNAHRFLTSDSLKDKDRMESALNVLMILNYRYLTGIMNRFFQYPIDQQMAQALYANLSYKFIIKKEKNWNGVMEYRARSMIGEGSLHDDTITQFTDDESILKAIADSQGRIKDMMKNIYKEFIQVHRSGQRIYLNSDTMMDEEGMEVLRDRTSSVDAYIDYMVDIIKDTNTFIKNELVEIVMNLMDNVNVDQFVELLEWTTKQSFNENEKDIEDLVRTNLIFSFDYINENQSILHHTKDLGAFLSTLRGAYMSSRSTDPNLFKLRELGDSLVKKAMHTTNNAVLVALRTSLLLYINLRTYTKSHYRG